MKSTGHGLDDDAFITLLARSLLLAENGEAQPARGGETEPPRGGSIEVGSNYRIGLITCPSCKKTVRTGGSEDVVVEPHVLEAALCHAEVVAVDGDPGARRRQSRLAFSVPFGSGITIGARCRAVATRSSICIISTSGPRAAPMTQIALGAALRCA